MRKSLAVLSCASMASLLSACSGTWDVDGLKAANTTGTAFDSALKDEYVALASAEKSEYDWRDVATFVERGQMAAMGTPEAPENLADRDIPEAAQADLAAARETLMGFMTDDVKAHMPKELAAAQASYECWMQEQEENWQSKDIAACRAHFDAAIKALSKKPAPVIASENTFTVYFGFDSYKLEGDAVTVISEAAAAFKAMKAKKADVAGHADSSGDAKYNDRISALRAEAVGNALIKQGIPEDAIQISAYGEGDQAVKTGDGQKEPRNRRVTITLSK